MRLLFTALACLISVSVFGQELDFDGNNDGCVNIEDMLGLLIEFGQCSEEEIVFNACGDSLNHYNYYYQNHHQVRPFYFLFQVIPQRASSVFGRAFISNKVNSVEKPNTTSDHKNHSFDHVILLSPERFPNRSFIQYYRNICNVKQ